MCSTVAHLSIGSRFGRGPPWWSWKMQMLIYSLAVMLNAAALNPSQSSAQASEAVETEDRMVCRTVRKTGTRFDDRICKRQSEWRAIEEKSTTTVRDIQARPQINCTTPSGSAC